MKKHLSLLLITMILMSCGKSNYVNISALEPAPVSMPNYIKKVGLINRSNPNEQDKILDVVDKVLSAEGRNMDEKAAIQGMMGLRDELMKNDKLQSIILIDDIRLQNTVFGNLPNPVSWARISEICQEYDLDALFVLEYFDTESKVTYSNREITTKNALGLEIPIIEHIATNQTLIKTGWRIYVPASSTIIDEFRVNTPVTTVGRGINPVEAAAAIIGRTEAVNRESYILGQRYAARIVPYWTTIRREYYVKGSDTFKVAKRRAQTGNWDGAGQLWFMETKNSKAKIAGRAWHNLAIISEIDGNLDEAINRASIAYEDFGIKHSLRYVNLLKNRQYRIERLRAQQSEIN